MVRNPIHRLIALATLALACALTPVTAETARETIARAALAGNDRAQREIIATLAGLGDDAIPTLLDAWKRDELFIHTPAEGPPVAVQLIGTADADGTREALRVADGAPLVDAAGTPARLAPAGLKAVEHTSGLRRAMKAVLDLVDLGSPDPATRIRAIETLGRAQTVDKLPILRLRLESEQDAAVRRKLVESIALIELKAPDDAVRIAALGELRELHTLASADFVEAARKEAKSEAKRS